ncbi:MAG TPA: polysaccharide pyruvyl transferase family protein [Armatimonadota bacterium]|uniref:Polysaccharide pyruvyl transferase n=1 Tax=Methanothrix thermoacetophila (strain DSM 6194 / JCM 14653 / NBRC 101360 / PT) TaxID=349307 RepID=A0B7S4_METTP|nr:polysaccharide pyruvyl transferase family protein [Methanothrix thermoacetophila]ABK14748.1 polysaccharide pyruvyl transferase [Methanothrix thermoacetophila PT]HPP76193.1 polysaccharide pyruvyl transferase family protein [Armatimonadota bacterium]
MGGNRLRFILAGNGPYENRGCEAIVRGTVKILREHFKDPQFICLSHFQNDEQFRKQCLEESDPSITHLRSYILSKKKAIKNFWKPGTWSYVYRHFFNRPALKYHIYRDMLSHLDDAAAVLSVGGDNYSLDYGVPQFFTDLDDIVLEKKKPLFLWGASVGPFSAIPEYERYMRHHLKEVTGIFARESLTINYLKSIGVTENVYSVADPAFLMEPVKPQGIDAKLPINGEAIGINLSPLMAKYVTNGDLEVWSSMAASIIESVAQKTGLLIYLIPHVTQPNQFSNDYAFMQRVLSQIKDKYNIIIVPPVYNAAETKWIISRMTLFAGARMHSTIAAISSGVPTLSFAYSIKARGINRDIFGHTNYCMDPEYLDSKAVAGRVTSMLDEVATIRKELAWRIPEVQRAAQNAGMLLRHLIGDN